MEKMYVLTKINLDLFEKIFSILFFALLSDE